MHSCWEGCSTNKILLTYLLTLLKKEAHSQKRLKLLIKVKLCDGQTDCSHVCRETRRLKRLILRCNLGVGPELKMDFPHFLRSVKRHVKSYFEGVVWNFGHQTSFPNEPVCFLSLETFFNTFHSVLLVAGITGARLAQVELLAANSFTHSTVHPRQIDY